MVAITVFPDFPKYADQPQVVRKTLQKLSAAHKILWYSAAEDDAPIIDDTLIPDFGCSPGNIVDKLEGVRHVGWRFIKDWTYSAFNSHLPAVDVDYATIDRLFLDFIPGCAVAGIDFVNCFSVMSRWRRMFYFLPVP